LIDSEILTLFWKRKVEEAYQQAKDILVDELVEDALDVLAISYQTSAISHIF